MPNLNCTASNCTHNTQNQCCNNSIQVGGRSADKSKATSCESFVESSGAFTNSVQTPNPSMSIGCEAANCVHNCDEACQASTVDISGASASSSCDTKCSSFQYRY